MVEVSLKFIAGLSLKLAQQKISLRLQDKKPRTTKCSPKVHCTYLTGLVNGDPRATRSNLVDDFYVLVRIFVWFSLIRTDRLWSVYH